MFCLAFNILNVPTSAYAETKDVPSKIQQENKTPVSEENILPPDVLQPDEMIAIEKALEAKSKFYKNVSAFFSLQSLPSHYREFRKMPKPKDADAKNDNDVKKWLNNHQAKYEKFKNHIKAEAIKLKAEDRLDSAINFSRTAFLKLVTDLEKIYSNKNHSLNHSLILVLESLNYTFNMGVPELWVKARFRGFNTNHACSFCGKRE